ncbi:MAG: hypothetical protein CME10_07855 [Gemmatimonadetes bacterium]|nr:hypothetical protein [Gemmatimonadota bacterium]
MKIDRTCFILHTFALFLYASNTFGQIQYWVMGGHGISWETSDSSNAMIQFDKERNCIYPRYFSPGENIYLAVGDWSELRNPQELGFLDGHQPRLWFMDGLNAYATSYFDSPLYVDGDRSTYNTARDGFWTIDVGVPVPAFQFALYTPTSGTRSDGLPLNKDSVPAFEITASEESDESIFQLGYNRLPTLISNVTRNFDSEVEFDFRQQYVRFIRFNRNESIIDEQNTTDSNTIRGTISEFVLRGEGVPKRAIYRSKILPIGREVNFGRLFWSVRMMRMVEGEPVLVEDGEAWLEVEMRTGRDEDPNVYHEYTDSGKEFPVSRDRYENVLRDREGAYSTGAILQADRRPGIRASVQDDSENWSFWSSQLFKSGSAIDLRNGSFMQIQLSLKSRSFFDWVEVDSLWFEVSNPLAERVVGEVARLDDPQPAHGFTQVDFGDETEFVYDLRGYFSENHGGFDVVRVNTRSRPKFVRLEIGEFYEIVEPKKILTDDFGFSVQLSTHVKQSNNLLIRLVFSSSVYIQAVSFEAEVYDSSLDLLPQPVEAGDVSAALSTNDFNVIATTKKIKNYANKIRVNSGIVTPNGDGTNDEWIMNYELYSLPYQVVVNLVVFDIEGKNIVRIDAGVQEAGLQEIRWNIRDNNNHLLAPGLYFVGFELETDSGNVRHVRPVGIAY